MNIFRRTKSSPEETTPPGEVECSNITNDDEISPGESGEIVTKGSSGSGTLKRMVSSVLPKVERLPWTTFFSLSTWCALPAAVYILLFTQMGFGELFYYKLSHKYGGEAYKFAGILAIAGFFFYILDIGEWKSWIGKVTCYLSATAMFSMFVLLVILVSIDYPFALINLYAVLNPMWLLTIRALFYRGQDKRTYVSWLSGPLLFVGLLTTVAFIVWVCLDHDNEWNSVTKVEAAQETGCEPNYDDYPKCISDDGSTTCFYVDSSGEWEELVFPEGCDQSCINVYSGCSNGFLLWAGPVLMTLSMLFLSFFCTFLRTEGTTEQDMVNFGKLWCVVVLIMWAAASLSGTTAVTSSLSSLTFANMVGSAIILSSVFSKEERDTNKEAVFTRIREKYGDNNLNIGRGLFIVTCSPILVAYFCLSAINQMVRRIGINPCAQPTHDTNDPDKNAGVVTVRAKAQLTKMRSWDRAKVFTYAVYWGVAYMILQVIVSQLTVVFLSW